MFYVYKRPPGRRTGLWDFVSEHSDATAADAAARAVCGKGPLYTEPGAGLDAGFFAPTGAVRWASMITTEKLEASKL